MKKSHSKRGIIYEKTQCTKRGGKHKGGPGNTDCSVKGKDVEIKNWATSVHSGIVKVAAKKKVNTIVSKSGFTQPASILAKLHNIKLEKGK